jgi:serine/threonine protein kinase
VHREIRPANVFLCCSGQDLDFVKVLDFCLAKDPSARPQTARRLSHRLAEVADADPWTEENARLWWERYRFQS